MSAWLEGRARRTSQFFNPGTRVRTELDLWRGVLSEELRRQHWTLPELGLLADLHNDVIGLDAIPIDNGLVAHGVIDSFQADPGIYGDKWSVDEAALSKRSPSCCSSLALTSLASGTAGRLVADSLAHQER